MSCCNKNNNFEKVLEIGRPPNIKKLFPNSKALIVSGKVIDRAMIAKGKAMTIAANARNSFIMKGTLMAAQRANAAIIIEIAKSESTYCQIGSWNLAVHVDQLCNELGITVPVAIHADHYGIKNEKDLEIAKVEIPSMFDAGITSIAIDASHLPEDKNLLANIELNKYVPAWAGLETEVGEIKGDQGLSTPKEAVFQIAGLNANGVFPDWIALNNGTVHGLEASNAAGIQVELTAEIHNKLAKYKMSGAQHGTSGNSSEKLREIAQKTNTTKANVATALQMISWGLEVNDYGNATVKDGNFVKVKGKGADEEMWASAVTHANEKGWKIGDYKKLNLAFENKFCGQSKEVRDRMAKDVEDFVYKMLVDVFNAKDTAPLAIDAILKAGSHDLGAKVGRVEDPAEWTPAKITEKASKLGVDRGPDGDFDD
ncbi:MAG: class II fructose-bisphosphate aldolase [Spirochaetes bacterium]|nr:class II fructose-bisphosphate aldolase [Spirochaetota bacterium]